VLVAELELDLGGAQPTAAFGPATVLPGSSTFAAREAMAGDLDGDGIDDLALAREDGISIFLGKPLQR
jgi:hypothetical protein